MHSDLLQHQIADCGLTPCYFIALYCKDCGESSGAVAEVPSDSHLPCPHCQASSKIWVLRQGKTLRPLPIWDALAPPAQPEATAPETPSVAPVQEQSPTKPGVRPDPHADALTAICNLLRRELNAVTWKQEEDARTTLEAQPSTWQLILAVKAWARALAEALRLRVADFVEIYAASKEQDPATATVGRILLVLCEYLGLPSDPSMLFSGDWGESNGVCEFVLEVAKAPVDPSDFLSRQPRLPRWTPKGRGIFSRWMCRPENDRAQPEEDNPFLSVEETQPVLRGLEESFRNALFNEIQTAFDEAVLASWKCDSVRAQVEQGRPQREPQGIQFEVDNKFVRENQVWSISYKDEVVRLPQLAGLEYIAILLRTPGEPIACKTLEGRSRLKDALVIQSNTNAYQDWGGATSDEHMGLPCLDERAVAEYEAEARHLEAEIARARKRNDTGTVEKLSQDLEIIAKRLQADTGLAGKSRILGDDRERARVRVTNAIKEIAKQAPKTASHLTANIETGASMIYRDLPRYHDPLEAVAIPLFLPE